MKAAWNFLLHHWLGSGLSLAIVAAVALLCVLNPAAALKLASSIAGLVLGVVRDAIEWARRPHDWWRIGCVTLGVLFALASFAAYDQRQKVIVVTRVAEADAETCKRTIAARDASLAGYQKQQADFARIAREEAERLRAAQAQSAEALADIERQQAQAAKSNAAWWSVYAKRPDACKAAQEAMDAACPLESY